MTKHFILGIDPGQSGALALVDVAAPNVIVIDMPVHEIRGKKHLDLYQLARWIDLYAASVSRAVVEEVGAMPKQGVSSSFKFGFNAGAANMAVAAAFIPAVLVRPNVWKREMGVAAAKTTSRQAASRLFPAFSHLWHRETDDGRAEAVLLAVYGSRMQ